MATNAEACDHVSCASKVLVFVPYGQLARDDWEEPVFSVTSCDGCGDCLSGDRFEYTLFPANPEGLHAGHYGPFGTYFCDTCNSPYCDNA